MESKWDTYSLTDLYSISSGLSKKREEFGFGYPFLTFKDVFHNTFLPAELTELANTEAKERQKCSIEAGDVFLTRTSEKLDELGLSSVALKDYPNATFNGFTKRLRPNGLCKNILIPEYAAFYMRSSKFRNQVTSFSSMTTRASLNNEMISKLTIDIPPLNIQKNIISILYNLLEKEESNNRSIALLEEISQTIFKHWFIDFEFPNKQGHPYKSSGGEMIESELGDLPKGWTVKELGEIVEIQNGFAFKAKDYIEKGIKVTRTLNISKSDFLVDNRDAVCLPDNFYSDLKYQKQHLNKFDVLLVMVGASIGNLGIILSDNLPTLQNQNMWRFRSKNNNISNILIYYYTLMINDNVKNWSTGSAREFYRKDTFNKYKICLPEIEILSKTNMIFEEIFNRIDLLNSENNILDELRDTLIPRLLSGDMEIPDELVVD